MAALCIVDTEITHDRTPFATMSLDWTMASCCDQVGDLVGDRVVQKVGPVTAGDLQIKS